MLSESDCKILPVSCSFLFLLDCDRRGREEALRHEVGMTNSLRMALNWKEYERS